MDISEHICDYKTIIIITIVSIIYFLFFWTNDLIIAKKSALIFLVILISFLVTYGKTNEKPTEKILQERILWGIKTGLFCGIVITALLLFYQSLTFISENILLMIIDFFQSSILFVVCGVLGSCFAHILIELKPYKEEQPDIYLSLFAVIIALSSLGFSSWFYLDFGYVDVQSPTIYAIDRQIQKFNSNCIVLPMTWTNTGGQPVIISDVDLTLDNTDLTSNESHKYELGGEYSEISNENFENDNLTPEVSFVLPPHSNTPKNLIFRIDRYWETNTTKNPDCFFNFTTKGETVKYNAILSYKINGGPTRKRISFILPIFEAVNNLNNEKNAYDYYTTELGE